MSAPEGRNLRNLYAVAERKNVWVGEVMARTQQEINGWVAYWNLIDAEDSRSKDSNRGSR